MTGGERLVSEPAASQAQQSSKPLKPGNYPADIFIEIPRLQTPMTSRKLLSARTRCFRPVVVTNKVDADGDILDIEE